MGLFYTAPKSTTPTPESGSHSGSQHISSHEAREQVRRDLHDKLGLTKGEQVFNIIGEDLDRDGGFGSRGISGREVDDMVQRLNKNHQDNLHTRDIDHIKEVLGKHLND